MKKLVLFFSAVMLMVGMVACQSTGSGTGASAMPPNPVLIGKYTGSQTGQYPGDFSYELSQNADGSYKLHTSWTGGSAFSKEHKNPSINGDRITTKAPNGGTLTIYTEEGKVFRKFVSQSGSFRKTIELNKM